MYVCVTSTYREKCIKCTTKDHIYMHGTDSTLSSTPIAYNVTVEALAFMICKDYSKGHFLWQVAEWLYCKAFKANMPFWHGFIMYCE